MNLSRRPRSTPFVMPYIPAGPTPSVSMELWKLIVENHKGGTAGKLTDDVRGCCTRKRPRLIGSLSTCEHALSIDSIPSHAADVLDVRLGVLPCLPLAHGVTHTERSPIARMSMMQIIKTPELETSKLSRRAAVGFSINPLRSELYNDL